MSTTTSIQRPLPWIWADFMRGCVRLMFPIGSLFVLVGLIYSDQGRDVLRALLTAASTPADGKTSRSVSGLLFLAGSSAILSTSLWYASRWLLCAQMAALPLPEVGFWQTWLPRLLGIAAPVFIAIGLLLVDGLPFIPGSVPITPGAVTWAGVHLGTAVGLLLFYRGRGWIMEKLAIDSAGTRQGPGHSHPIQIGLHQEVPRLTRLVAGWSIALSVGLAILFIVFPITMPRAVGAAAVAALALASINLFGSFVLTYLPLRRALPPMWFVLMLFSGVVVSRCNDNHVVQPAPILAAPVPGALGAWSELDTARAQGPVAIYIASEGGGIRAAYWTVAVLDALDRLEPTLKQHYRVMSGVSGGSLGLAAWLASHRETYCPDAPRQAGSAVWSGDAQLSATRALGADFVSPAVAGMFYGDLIQRFIPHPFGWLDRSRAIEGAWLQAFEHLPGKPFEQTLDAVYRGCPQLPELLLNATRVETGQRVVLSRLEIDPLPPDRSATLPPFLNTFNALQHHSTARVQSLAGLVHHSARFPAVSPAGTVELPGGQPASVRLVDGGYFDNSGVLSALDLIEDARRRAALVAPPLLLLVRNDMAEPIHRQADHPAEASSLFPEIGSIAGAMLAARGSHAVTACAMALRALGDRVIDLQVPHEIDEQKVEREAPLGWALSSTTRAMLDRGAMDVARKACQAIHERISPTGAHRCQS